MNESNSKKHAAPLRCRIDVLLRGKSPSKFIYCRFGARATNSPLCKRCREKNLVAEQIQKGFAEGLASGANIGNIHDNPELLKGEGE
jgi:hypothetical protein